MTGPVSTANDPRLPARVLAALGATAPSVRRQHAGAWIIAVDDITRRYRDAIEAGATPLRPPTPLPEGRGCSAEIATGPGGVRIILEQQ